MEALSLTQFYVDASTPRNKRFKDPKCMQMKMQATLNDNNAKQMQERKSNDNVILIYENKYGSKLIRKCKDETS